FNYNNFDWFKAAENPAALLKRKVHVFEWMRKYHKAAEIAEEICMPESAERYRTIPEMVQKADSANRKRESRTT
ncbi:MAG: hypothetical protein DRN71_04915, partial [Candidatus Nanohalarchaeota archaeon]